MVGLICIILGLLVAVAVWVQGIDSMHKNYPDYKGEDLFGEEPKQQCKDCNDNLTNCTCIEDTVDMKQETLKEAAEKYAENEIKDRGNDDDKLICSIDFMEGAKLQEERMYSEEEVIDIAKQAFVLGKDFGLIGTFSEWFEQFRKK